MQPNAQPAAVMPPLSADAVAPLRSVGSLEGEGIHIRWAVDKLRELAPIGDPKDVAWLLYAVRECSVSLRRLIEKGNKVSLRLLDTRRCTGSDHVLLRYEVTG